MPADSVGTFGRATDGTLMVGIFEHQPWAHFDDSTGSVTGSEVELIQGFAETINAEIEWKDGPESVLAHDMKEGHLDVMIGGLTDTSPWSSHMALTRPYATIDEENMVMGVRMGENELMVELERYLAREGGEIS